jgi:hypothetical protein
VRLAARNTQQAWLADGEGVAPTLGEGASVIVYPGAQINDGVRVRAR